MQNLGGVISKKFGWSEGRYENLLSFLKMATFLSNTNPPPSQTGSKRPAPDSICIVVQPTLSYYFLEPYICLFRMKGPTS